MSLRKEVRSRTPRGNRFWLKAAAFSLTIKIALVVALFFAVRAAL